MQAAPSVLKRSGKTLNRAGFACPVGFYGGVPAKSKILRGGQEADAEPGFGKGTDRGIPGGFEAGRIRKTAAGIQLAAVELVEKGGTAGNGKEDSYERNPGGVSQGELPRSGKRGWPGPFVLNLSFSELIKF